MAHQRSCRITSVLTGAAPNLDRVAYNPELAHTEDTNKDLSSDSTEDFIPCLDPVPGLKLPCTATDWHEANLFFSLNKPFGDNITSISDIEEGV